MMRQKTNEAFVSHPDFGLIYKTGDCGKMHPEGYIEFLGRQDYQVKIQGYQSRVRRNRPLSSHLQTSRTCSSD